MSDANIRVFLVDDHRLFLSGVRSELGGAFEIVGAAGDVDSAVQGIVRSSAYVVLLDVHVPGGGGAEIVRRALRGGAESRFLALSVSDAAEDGIGVIPAGPRGYSTNPSSPADLADAIRRVNDGDAVFSPRLAGFVLDAFAGSAPQPIDPELDQLTAREREVLRYIARGYTYKEIGKELHLSVKTVESHVSAVLRKLQLTNRYELSRWATERRLV